MSELPTRPGIWGKLFAAIAIFGMIVSATPLHADGVNPIDPTLNPTDPSGGSGNPVNPEMTPEQWDWIAGMLLLTYPDLDYGSLVVMAYVVSGGYVPPSNYAPAWGPLVPGYTGP